MATRPWLGLIVTEAQLIADIAEGYDVVVVGADKWAQISDPAWYGGSTQQRTRPSPACRRCSLFLAHRPAPSPTGASPAAGIERLDVDPAHEAISSTAVRGGQWHWMAPEAAAFDVETGAWSDPDRYARSQVARGRPGGSRP